jgi:hypothetical protein
VSKFKGKVMAITGYEQDQVNRPLHASICTQSPLKRLCRPPDELRSALGATFGGLFCQVMVTPTGQPGVNPSQDVSVPINWAYNHHYSATLPQPRPLSAVTCLDHALLLLLLWQSHRTSSTLVPSTRTTCCRHASV